MANLLIELSSLRIKVGYAGNSQSTQAAVDQYGNCKLAHNQF